MADRRTPCRTSSLIGRIGLVALLCSAALPMHAAPDPKAARYYEDALARYERRDINGAIVQLKNALQIDKNMLPVQLLLGKALMANGDAVGAEVAMTEAMRLGVSRAEVVVALAKAYVAQGKQKLVLEQALFSTAGLPADVRAQLLLLRSAASADLGDMRVALQAVDEAKALDPKSPEPWIAEVPVRIRTRQFREATEASARALDLAPRSAEAWYQKGSVAHVQGNLRDAVDAYDRALTADAEHLEARVARAGLRIDLGRFADAAADVAELRRTSPREPRAAYLRSLLAERDNDPAAARAELRQVTGLIDPVPLDFIRYRPQLLILNGLAHFALDEREKATPYLEAAQKVQANTPVSKLLARIYLAEPNVARAIEVLEAYLKTRPADSQALTLLASAHMAQGRHAKATALMQEALRTRDVPEFRTALGLSLIGGGEAADAAVQLEAAFKKDPGQTQAGAALAAIYLRSGQGAKALVIAEALVKRQPGHAGFQNLLGLARVGTGDGAGAKQAFEKAVQLDDGLMQAKLSLARLDIASKAFDSASARLASILRADERNVDAMLEQAALANRRGDAADSLRWLEKADASGGPHELRPGLALIDLHLRSGRAGPALEAAKRVASKAPDDPTVLKAYARAQLANADNIPARATLTNATRVAGFNPPAQVEIALLQMAANNPSGAAYSLDKALSAAPDFLPALALMTDVELRLGDVGKAEKRARQIVENNPKRAIGHSLVGDVAVARGQVAAAVDAYRRAHLVEPSSETLLRLFRALSARDGAKSALVLAEQWIKTHPRDVPVRKALADGHARSANYSAARAGYEAVLELAPDDADVLNSLANVLLRLKDPGALKVAEQAAAKSPGNPNIIDTLGWVLYQAGQTERALQLLRDARLRNPANPEIRFHLATVLAHGGRKAEARDELEAALKGGGPFEGRAEAEKLLRTLK